MILGATAAHGFRALGAGSILICTLLLISACSSTGPIEARPDSKPAWLLSPPTHVDRLYGVGGASAAVPRPQRLAAARDAALADLVAGLRVEVRNQTRSRVIETRGGVEARYVQETETRVEPLVLEAVRTRATWESDLGALYVMVALDRTQAAARVRQAYTDAMQARPRPGKAEGWQAWREWLALRRWLTEQSARDDLHRLFTGQGVSAQWPERRHQGWSGYAAFVAQQPLRVETGGTLTDDRAAPVLAVWNDQGFPLLSAQEAVVGSASAPWRLDLSARFDDQSDSRFTRLFVTLHARLTDAQDQVRWQTRLEARGIAVSRDMAATRALEAVAEKLRADWLAVGDRSTHSDQL